MEKIRIRNYGRIKTYELELDQWTDPYNYYFKLESIKVVYEMYTEYWILDLVNLINSVPRARIIIDNGEIM